MSIDLLNFIIGTGVGLLASYVGYRVFRAITERRLLELEEKLKSLMTQYEKDGDTMNMQFQKELENLRTERKEDMAQLRSERRDDMAGINRQVSEVGKDVKEVFKILRQIEVQVAKNSSNRN